jgi:CRP-like cAMP-binding protein
MPEPERAVTDPPAAPAFTDALGALDRAALAEVGTVRHFEAGEPLLLQGQRQDRVFVLLRGRVKVVSTAADGTEVMLALRGAGELVGDIAAVEETEGGASVRTLEAVTARVITTPEFRRFLERRPGAALALVRVLAGRLRDADRQRVQYAATTVLERLASALVGLAERYGHAAADRSVRIGLRLTRSDLATMVAASPESVDRAWRILRARGVVERDAARHLVVRDLATLREVAATGMPRL